MDKKWILEQVADVYRTCNGNTIDEPDKHFTMFDEPLVGVASAEDELFSVYKQPDVIGPWFLKPTEWLAGAKTVISIFFPFSAAVKESNRRSVDLPSDEWAYGRIEGQAFIKDCITEISNRFTRENISNLVPLLDERFAQVNAGNHFQEYDCVTEKTYGSNWSERHAAFACGLGTFGLSKGIITEKGMAGRFASIIIAEEIPADVRPYTEVYEYCTMCGACVKRCPVQAISIEEGKNHTICHGWLTKTKELCAPRFGCGLCQTKVPCESQIPSKKRNKCTKNCDCLLKC